MSSSSAASSGPSLAVTTPPTPPTSPPPTPTVGSNAATTTSTTSTNNNNSDNNGGGKEQVEALTVQQVQQQQQQQQQQRSSSCSSSSSSSSSPSSSSSSSSSSSTGGGGDDDIITMHVERELVELFVMHTQCPFDDLARHFIDNPMTDFVEVSSKDLALCMRSPLLFRKPETKKAIRAALVSAAQDIPADMLEISRGWPVRDLPKISAEAMIRLGKAESFQSTLGGVVVRCVLRGESDHQAQQEQQSSSSPSNSSSGSDIITMHVERELVKSFLLYTQCRFDDLIHDLFDDTMMERVDSIRKDIGYSMRSPMLCKKKHTKEAIRTVLARVAKELPEGMLRISRGWSVRDLPKVPTESIKKLNETNFFHSTLGGIRIHYVLDGERDHQVVDKTNTEQIKSTLLEDKGFVDIFVAEPPEPVPPPASSHAEPKSLLKGEGVEDMSMVKPSDSAPLSSTSSSAKPKSLLKGEGVEDMSMVEPSDSAPPSPGSQAETAAIVNEVTAATSGINNDESYDNHSPGSDKPPLALSSSTEKDVTDSSAPLSPKSQTKKGCSLAEEDAVGASDMDNHDSDDGSAGSDKPPSLSSSTEKQVMTAIEPPASVLPAPVATNQAKKAHSIAKEAAADAHSAGGNSDGDDDNNDCSSSNKPLPPPPLSSPSDGGSATPPPTPPRSPSMSSSASMDDSPPTLNVEPSPLAQLPSSPSLSSTSPTDDSPPPTPPRTFSVNPLGGMFSPPLDKPGVIKVIRDVLCCQRVLNNREKAAMTMKEIKSGCVSAETLEWVLRGLRSLRGKKELQQRRGGLVFVGPQWGAPQYKTGNGVGRLLRGVAKKHGAGTKFVVCVSSASSSGNSNNSPSNVKMITGIISSASPNTAASSSAASSPASPAPPSSSDATGRVEPVMDGDAPRLQDWSNVRGNLDDGCRLWAWVY